VFENEGKKQERKKMGTPDGKEEGGAAFRFFSFFYFYFCHFL
jgi:hypothetical protein